MSRDGLLLVELLWGQPCFSVLCEGDEKADIRYKALLAVDDVLVVDYGRRAVDAGLLACQVIGTPLC